MTQPNPYGPPQPQNPYGQPQSQQAPPNPFGPGAAPAYAPQAPVATPVYAPPTQYAGNPAGAGLTAQPGQFMRPSAPPAGGNGDMPRMQHLATGRALLILPESIERNRPGKARQGDLPGAVPQPYDRITATVVVLDGGPVQWGGTSPQDPVKSGLVPFVIKGMFITQKNVVAQLQEALQVRQAGGPGLLVARLWKTGPEQNAAFVLQDPDEAAVQAYNAYVSQVNPFQL